MNHKARQAPAMKTKKPALELNPTAPMLCSTAKILVAATAPPYTTDWTNAAIEFAATPAAVNPICASPNRIPTRAKMPPTRATNTAQHTLSLKADQSFPSPFVLLSGKRNVVAVYYTLLHNILTTFFMWQQGDLTNLSLKADLNTSNMYYFWRMPTSRSDKFGGSSHWGIRVILLCTVANSLKLKSS